MRVGELPIVAAVVSQNALDTRYHRLALLSCTKEGAAAGKYWLQMAEEQSMHHMAPRCLLRVISGHTDKSAPCPLYPQ